MIICNVNTLNFGAKIQFDNGYTEKKQTFAQRSKIFCRRTHNAARRTFIVPMFFSSILSKIIKVRKSIKLPS